MPAGRAALEDRGQEVTPMRTKLVATIVAVAVAATFAGAPTPPAGAVDDPDTSAAVAWLLDQQQADGSFEVAGFPGFETPDAVLAIAQQAQVEPAWSAALARDAVDAATTDEGVSALDHLDDRVETLVQPVEGETEAEAAARGAQLAKIFALVILPLAGTPGIARGDFDPSGDSDDPVNVRPTILAAEGDGTFGAMEFTGRLYVLLVGGTGTQALVDHVEAAQQPNGAWNFTGTPSGAEVDADTTGLALQALSVNDVPATAASVRGGLRALAKSQQADGGWLSFGALDPNSTAMAVLGIRAAGGDPQTPCWREAADPAWAGVPYVDPVGWLREQQAGDGHVASPSDEFGVTTFATSQSVQAILGLNPLFDVGSPAPGCADVADEERFVHAAYHDVLGRLADDAGTTTFAAKLRDGVSPGSVAHVLTGSPEYARRTVDGFFRTYLGRPADSFGLRVFAPVVTTRRLHVQSSILGSNEYFRKAGGTNGDFVDALYEDVLGRPADGGGRATFLQLLESGRSRVAVAQTLLVSSEARGDLLAQLYDQLLRRPIDSFGKTFWRRRLAEGTTVETVIASLIGSSEYVSNTASS